MSFVELNQCLLSIACVSVPSDATIFTYEVALVVPSLFQDKEIMMKSQKSLLGKYIMWLDSNILMYEIKEHAARVVDGFTLLHRLTWAKVGDLNSSCCCKNEKLRIPSLCCV